jgi:hypothetical protein
VTVDAAFTQWTVAQQIVHQGGAYFMVVERNQPQIRACIADCNTARRGIDDAPMSPKTIGSMPSNVAG